MVVEDVLRGSFNVTAAVLFIVEASPPCLLVGSDVSLSRIVSRTKRLKLSDEPFAKQSFRPNSALCSKFYPRNINLGKARASVLASLGLISGYSPIVYRFDRPRYLTSAMYIIDPDGFTLTAKPLTFESFMK